MYESLGERSSELLRAVAASHLEDANRKRAPQHSPAAPTTRHVRNVEDIASICACLTRNKMVADETGKDIKPLQMTRQFLEALEESADGIFYDASLLNPVRRGHSCLNQTSLLDILEAYDAFGVPCQQIGDKALDALGKRDARRARELLEALARRTRGDVGEDEVTEVEKEGEEDGS